jgi:tRNA threonylcarbamoyladenosine biosynthesis protein TsaB
LGIDTCGPTGSVALGRMADARLSGSAVEILAQTELEGRSYSSTLVAAVRDLLAGAGVPLGELHAILAVSGPGSFTGVRVGLSAVKGLAEGARIPVATVSRLEVLAAKAGCRSAALDAHRHEIFLRLAPSGALENPQPRELLAGAEELAALARPSGPVAVCDDPAAALLASAWPAVELMRCTPPTAADALQFCAGQIVAGSFVDLALLDGHYLRRSDAEIFGEAAVGARTA